MREFNFQLRLPDGRVVQARATARKWEWAVAFTEACVSVERTHGLGSWAAITCVDYTSRYVDEFAPVAPISIDVAAVVPPQAWGSFCDAA